LRRLHCLALIPHCCVTASCIPVYVSEESRDGPVGLRVILLKPVLVVVDPGFELPAYFWPPPVIRTTRCPEELNTREELTDIEVSVRCMKKCQKNEEENA